LRRIDLRSLDARTAEHYLDGSGFGYAPAMREAASAGHVLSRNGNGANRLGTLAGIPSTEQPVRSPDGLWCVTPRERQPMAASGFGLRVFWAGMKTLASRGRTASRRSLSAPGKRLPLAHSPAAASRRCNRGHDFAHGAWGMVQSSRDFTPDRFPLGDI
jgi:hypothetical protein